MGSLHILLRCLFSIVIQSTSAYPSTLPNKTELGIGWKFSRQHPFQYFPSMKQIPHTYLPIQVSSISDRQGVWVLRHKEFSGAPKFFSGSQAESTAFIKYGTQSQFFENVIIKMLSYGNPEFQVKFPGQQKTLSILEDDNLKKCTGSGEDPDGPPKWMTFKIKTPSTSQVKHLFELHILK